MNFFKIKSVALATVLFLNVPAIAHANDISLPRSGKDIQLASLHPSIAANGVQKAAEAEDPVTEVLSVDEIDVWERIRQGFTIPNLDNHLVNNQLEWYSTRPEYIQRTTLRASRYLFHIVQELEARGMPTELALLPFIESAFNPHARSTASAEGMWQFIPGTGRDYQLRQTIFKDERRSVLASTDAALNYLQKLHAMFGDWQLALAAYNWGEGSVQRAIKKNQAAGLPIDFNSLSIRMPAETRNYVPKLQAVKNIVSNPGQYGIVLEKIDNQPYFVTIGKTRDIDVKVAAKLAEMPLEDFRALNPQFCQHVITGSSKTQILLPKENAEKFTSNLSQWKQPLSSWTAYQVKGKREKVETIAAKYGTTPDVIRQANHIPPKMVLKAGSTILVPKAAHVANMDIAPDIANNARMSLERDEPATRLIRVRVRKGDSLASLAKRHRVSVVQIKSWNKLHRNTVAAGTSLQLHVPHKIASGNKGSKRTAKRGNSTKTRLASAKKRQKIATGKTVRKKSQVVQAKPNAKAV